MRKYSWVEYNWIFSVGWTAPFKHSSSSFNYSLPVQPSFFSFRTWIRFSRLHLASSKASSKMFFFAIVLPLKSVDMFWIDHLGNRNVWAKFKAIYPTDVEIFHSEPKSVREKYVHSRLAFYNVKQFVWFLNCSNLGVCFLFLIVEFIKSPHLHLHPKTLISNKFDKGIFLPALN